MTKSLGCKVTNEIYDKVNALGIKSDILRNAIDFYLEHYQNITVNQVKPAKNKHSNKD